VLTLQSIATRIQFLIVQAAELDPELVKLVQAHPAGPVLLREPGVGPVVAAQLLVSWSHRGRVRSEAAFASLAGVAPLEASSGQHVRHRLNRGGDRDINRALHTVAITRLRCHAEIPLLRDQAHRPRQNTPRHPAIPQTGPSPTPLPPHPSRHPNATDALATEQALTQTSEDHRT
jgi:Transposase IS116/IS110/IS902 family